MTVTKPQAVIAVATGARFFDTKISGVTKPQAVIAVATYVIEASHYSLREKLQNRKR